MGRMSQVRLNKEATIDFPRKTSVSIKFKPQTFVLPPPKDIVPQNNNHSTSSPSNFGFLFFLPKKNLFSLSKTIPTCLEKGNSFTLPSSSSSFSLPDVTTVATVLLAYDIVVNTITVVVTVAINTVGATYRLAEIVVEPVNTHGAVAGDHHATIEEDLTVDIATRIVAGAAKKHLQETVLVR